MRWLKLTERFLKSKRESTGFDKLGFIGLTPKRIKKKEKIIKNKKCVPTARYINPSAKPTPILFFLIYYLFFNFFARKSPR